MHRTDTGTLRYPVMGTLSHGAAPRNEPTRAQRAPAVAALREGFENLEETDGLPEAMDGEPDRPSVRS